VPGGDVQIRAVLTAAGLVSKPLITSWPKPAANWNVSLPTRRSLCRRVAADDGVIAAAGIDDVVGTLAIDHVRVAVEANVFITVAANDILVVADRRAADRAETGSGVGDPGSRSRLHSGCDGACMPGGDAPGSGQPCVRDWRFATPSCPTRCLLS
jgi:hypothetical protein